MAEIRFVFGSKRNPVVMHLGDYEGRPRIDIRKYYYLKDNPEEMLPTRKGISLNHSELEQFLDILNSNKGNIDNYFQGNQMSSINQSFLGEGLPIGRTFDVEFQNGETKVLIGSELSKLKDKTSEEVMTYLLEAFYRSALDAIDDDDDFDMLISKLNFFLKRF